MRDVPNKMQKEMNRIRARFHSNCAICSPSNDRNLGLEFSLSEDGDVLAIFNCDQVFQGYTGCLHGGVISSLLDAAMTNCLFAHGVAAKTARLDIRFRHTVKTRETATIRAWLERSLRPLHVMKAELVQNKQIKATAMGKFIEQPDFADG